MKNIVRRNSSNDKNVFGGARILAYLAGIASAFSFLMHYVVSLAVGGVSI